MSRAARCCWSVLIRHLSVADLGWSADNPAPEEALEAIDEARDTSQRFLGDPPFIERFGPFDWWPEGSRVAALLVNDKGAIRAQVDPRTPGTAGLAPAQEHALLARAHRDGRRRRKEDDALLGDLADAMREQPGGSGT